MLERTTLSIDVSEPWRIGFWLWSSLRSIEQVGAGSCQKGGPSRLEDLRVPPSNRLAKLKGDLSGFTQSESTISGGSFLSGLVASRMRFGLLTIIDGENDG